MTKKKASEDFKRGYQRVMSSRTDAFEIKKSDKTKLKEKDNKMPLWAFFYLNYLLKNGRNLYGYRLFR